MVFWIVLFSSKMEGFAKSLYFIFLPLTGIPYILWVVHKEGQEPAEYLKDTYGSHPGSIWVVRFFLMFVVSSMSSVAAIVILGAFGFVFRLFT